jgi:GNAT superfamily N-acetyltransferase
MGCLNFCWCINRFRSNWYNPGVELHQIKDRKKLVRYFRQDLPTHAYSLGDLDDLNWPRTTYYGEIRGEGISRVSTLYHGEGLPVLLMFGPKGTFQNKYFRSLIPLLPDSFYAHFSPGLEELFSQDFNIVDHGDHNKMSLVEANMRGEEDSEKAFRLTDGHLQELLELYQQSYPENAFDPQMLVTGKYYGCRSGNSLVSVAGIHVYSSYYRVATLGNITTHPDHRNRGYARIVTRALCHDLLNEVEYIGLNVKADNLAAIRLYQTLGFEFASKYGEFSLKKRF